MNEQHWTTATWPQAASLRAAAQKVHKQAACGYGRHLRFAYVPTSRVLWAILMGLTVVSSAFAQQSSGPYTEVLEYEFNHPRTAIMAVEAEIRAASPDRLRAIEARLLKTLQSPKATTACKDWVCRQLRQTGSERSVAALAPLLADKDLATVARLALQSIPSNKVDAALRDAIGKVQGELKAGVIHTVGARRDPESVALLAPLAGDKDPVVAEAVLFALGQIGSADALRTLQAATVLDDLKHYRSHAILLCAEQMESDGKPADAAVVYHDLFQHSDDATIKTASLRGILATDKAKAATAVASALKADCPKLRLAAAQAVCERGGADILGRVLADLANLPLDVQVSILRLVQDKTASAAVVAAAQSDNEEVRLAALDALSRVGDSSSVASLLDTAAASQGQQQATARGSLQGMAGRDVDTALREAAGTGKVAVRTEAIRALAARNVTAAVPMLLKLAKDAERTVRAGAIGALGVLAGCQALSELVELLAEAETEAERSALEKATTATCQRQPRRAVWAAERVLAAMPGQDAEVRCSLLRVLASIPSDKSLEALRTALADDEPSVKDTAVRSLANWPDAAPAADLLRIARSSDSRVHQVLALRGAIRMATLPDGPRMQEKVKLVADAMNVASRPEEKKLALGALAELGHSAALELAVGYLSDEQLEVEAATAVVKIAKSVQKSDLKAAGAAIRKILNVCKTPAARQLAESSLIVVDRMVNIAPQGTATSPDDVEKDGTASGDQAAIDGNQGTYWDEENNQPLYRLLVTFNQPERIAAVSILGYQHHNYSPKDFEVLCDGKVVKKIEDAQYDDSFLVVSLDELTATTVELKITGYYGASPAVRELGIYRPALE